MEKFTEAQAVVYRSCAGGGYGDPLMRDPQRVAADVNRRWLSDARAEEVFGVALKPAANRIDWEVDAEKTRALRAARRTH
jgi:N-methylhydantoinase B